MYPFPCSPEVGSPAYRELMDGKPVAFCADLAQAGASADVTSFSLHAVSTSNVKLEFFCSSVLKEPLEDLVWEPCSEIESTTVKAGDSVFVQQAWNTTKRFLVVRVTPTNKKPTIMALSFCFGSAHELATKQKISRKLNVAVPRAEGKIFTPKELEEYIVDGFLNGTHEFGASDRLSPNFIYDVETGQALEFVGASWVSSGMNIADVFGSDVKVRNPATNRVYKT